MNLWNIIQTWAVLGVLFVNGWTDAPNAIASAIGSGAFSMKKGVWLATLMNLLGGIAALSMGQQVAKTMGALGNFPADTRGTAAVSACLLAVVIWAVAAWVFGIPTSESHGLMAALMGGALALNAGGISTVALLKVLVGLVFSVVFGFLGGWAISAYFQKRTPSPAFWKKGQRVAAAFMAFAHGLQDTPKFAALLVVGGEAIPSATMVLCSAVMGMGTLCGGGRIIRKVGNELVQLSPKEGFAADLAGAASLLLSTLQGLPVSTTHAKTCAMMGAALGHPQGTVDGAIARSMALAWLLTFPACGLLAFFFTKLFLLLPFFG